ncbi:uncharacterized protein BDV14DRAFT_163648 [Aspergillus stella-maris]|uniref:uncharacterized protein n=1 Tax=Aspergillus stella-maris TaxID=1810926 RepID=UPI003CCE1A32
MPSFALLALSLTSDVAISTTIRPTQLLSFVESIVASTTSPLSIFNAHLCVDYRHRYHAVRGLVKDPQLLHRLITQRPLLLPLCRRLSIRCTEDRTIYGDTVPYAGDYTAFFDFARYFTKATSFHLAGVDGQKEAWLLLQAVLSNFSGLNEVELTSTWLALRLDKLVKILAEEDSGSPPLSLRSLLLDEVSRNCGEKALRLLRSCQGTSSIKILKLRDFLQTQTVLSDLVKWPKALEVFDLQYIYTLASCGHQQPGVMGLYTEWSLQTLQPILELHKRTLRAITIRGLNKSGLTGFDVRGVSNLRELYLSDGVTGRDEMTMNLIQCLLAPNLRVFHWNLTLEDQEHSEELGSFAQWEEDFLRCFATEAVRKACPLHILRLTFNPIHSTLNEISLYPWDHMDKLDHEFREHGWDVRLEYNQPSITREAFKKEMRRVRGEDVEETDWHDNDNYDVFSDPRSRTRCCDREYGSRFLETL